MDEREHLWTEPAGERPPASGVLLFALCTLFLLAGFVVLMLGFDLGSGWLFGAGILVFSLAFLVPMTRRS